MNIILNQFLFLSILNENNIFVTNIGRRDMKTIWQIRKWIRISQQKISNDKTTMEKWVGVIDKLLFSVNLSLKRKLHKSQTRIS